MACLVIPQALSIALSIRELIRQGYLFGAHVFLRALVERAAILLYLHLYPDEIERWNRGWHQNDAPGLAKMFDGDPWTERAVSPYECSEIVTLVISGPIAVSVARVR